MSSTRQDRSTGRITVENADDTPRLSLVNDPREFAFAAERIDVFCAEHGLAEDIASRTNLAGNEPVTNAIGYGHDDHRMHRIELVHRVEGDATVAEIADDVRTFDLLPTPAPNLEPSV